MEQEILITVCARGGSKDIPNKNIYPVNGKHLIAYTIETAFKLTRQLNADILLSTDSEKIKSVAEEYGLKTDYSRPAELASDTAGKIGVLYDALHFQEAQSGKLYSHLLDLDVSSPLRTVEDVLEALEQLNSNLEALNIFSVSEARKNPYFNMVEKNEEGFYDLSKDGRTFFTRQSANEVLELNASFYNNTNRL